jgi:hypothetical protein
MLQLLAPVALLALVSLALPAVLHLWRPPAKRVRVGTLRPFTGPAVKRLAKLRWRERLLLLVRLLLLTTLVLLLARPFREKPPATSPQRWALLSADVALAGDALQRWRDLASAGYEMRLLGRGFPRVESRVAVQTAAHDPWSLLREADARLPAGSKIAVFASDRLAAFVGERPVLQKSAVEWVPATTGDAERSEWLVSVQLSPGKELQCVVASTGAAHTRSVRATVPGSPGVHRLPTPLDHASVAVQQNTGGEMSARLVRSDPAGPWVTVKAAAPLNVAILHARDRVEDAQYVEAAIRAISDNATVRVHAFAPGSDLSQADWIFWLNHEPVAPELTAEIAARGVDLLSDGASSSEAAESASFRFGNVAVGVARRVAAPNAVGASLWIDSFGRPLLTVEREGRGRHWRFFSRFHPEWNDLPRSSALPAALASLLLPEDGRSGGDLRRIDGSQGAPAAASGHGVTMRSSPERMSLHRLFWIVAAALFAVERALSLRTAAPKTPRLEQEPVLAT